MEPTGKEAPTADQVHAVLNGELGFRAAGVTRIGAGAWSTCFGFRADDRDLAIRVGKHRDDFDIDNAAARYAAPGLPIPEVLAVGEAFEQHYIISALAPGEPLEQVEPWEPLIEPVVEMLEQVRNAPIDATTGFGPWAGESAGSPSDGETEGWRDYLLAVNVDRSDWRTHGWSERLRTSPNGDRSFNRGYRMLEEVASDDVPRCLIHSDLLNRNVHVADGRITGVFDWGCSIYGDHLYDLAWFEFWAPWYPNIDVAALRATLFERWRATAYEPANVDERLRACHLHIGLNHLAYSAFLQTWDGLAEVEAQMRNLIDGFD